MTSKQSHYAPSKNPICRSFEDRGVTYELRLVNCCKPACKRCNTPDGKVASHGPYWYLCTTTARGWARIYLGRILDTSRYRNDDGSVRWKDLAEKRIKPPPGAGYETEAAGLPPGRPAQPELFAEADCIDETPPTADILDEMIIHPTIQQITGECENPKELCKALPNRVACGLST